MFSTQRTVHEEWMAAVQRDFPDITREQLERTRDLMNLHAEDCLVTGFEELIEGLELPDRKDRHVLSRGGSLWRRRHRDPEFEGLPT